MADNIYNILKTQGGKTMRTVELQKPQDHAISLRAAAALALLATLTLAPAQFAAAQGAVPCTAVTNDAERLACYDRALRGTPQPSAAPAAAAPTPAPARSTPPPATPPPVA